MNPSPTPTLTDYATLFTQQLRALGDTRQWDWDDSAGRLKRSAAAGTEPAPTEFVYLDNLHREWLRLAPAARPDGLRQAARSILQQRIPDSADEVRAHLLPLVRGAADRGQAIVLSPAGQPGLVHRPLCGSLEIQLGYDTPVNILRVCANHLVNWKLPEQDAWAIAFDNLRALSARPMKEIAPGTWESAWGDDHDAARLLLPDVLQRHRTRGAAVVGVPARGRLLLTGDQDTAGLATLVRQLELAQDQPRAMPPQLLRLVDGQWTDFAPAAHAAKLHGLRLLAEGQAYANQKHLLDERAKQRGEDVFVANVMLGRGADGQPTRSACVWSKGVVSLLPRAELLSLVDPQGNKADAIVIDWERAMPVIGHLMRETADVPPRFHVTAYPDESQLARLRQIAATPATTRGEAATQAPMAAASPTAARAPRQRRPVKPVARFEPKPLVMALVCLGLVAVAANHVREVDDTFFAALAWGGILFFGMLALLFGRVFYKALFPSAG